MSKLQIHVCTSTRYIGNSSIHLHMFCICKYILCTTDYLCLSRCIESCGNCVLYSFMLQYCWEEVFPNPSLLPPLYTALGFRKTHQNFFKAAALLFSIFYSIKLIVEWYSSKKYKKYSKQRSRSRYYQVLLLFLTK